MTCVWADDNQAQYGSVVNLRKRRKHMFTTAPHIRKVTTELSGRILTRLEFALHVEPVFRPISCSVTLRLIRIN